MNKQTLENAVWEAERFIKTAKQIKSYTVNPANGHPAFYHIESPSKETATCKRASMDLTRALTEMRKPEGRED